MRRNAVFLYIVAVLALPTFALLPKADMLKAADARRMELFGTDGGSACDFWCCRQGLARRCHTGCDSA